MVQAAAIIVWSFLRGIVEGMIMTRFTDAMVDPEAQDDIDGVRCHRWFRWYHLLCIGRDGALVAVVLLSATNLTIICNLLTIGALILGWELFEAAYNFTRYHRLITGHENVLGVVSLNNGADVWLLHMFRLLIGVGLIVWGLS